MSDHIMKAKIKELAYKYYRQNELMIEDGIPLALNSGIQPLDDRIPAFRAACWKLLGDTGWTVIETQGEPEIAIDRN